MKNPNRRDYREFRHNLQISQNPFRIHIQKGEKVRESGKIHEIKHDMIFHCKPNLLTENREDKSTNQIKGYLDGIVKTKKLR